MKELACLLGLMRPIAVMGRAISVQRRADENLRAIKNLEQFVVDALKIGANDELPIAKAAGAVHNRANEIRPQGRLAALEFYLDALG